MPTLTDLVPESSFNDDLPDFPGAPGSAVEFSLNGQQPAPAPVAQRDAQGRFVAAPAAPAPAAVAAPSPAAPPAPPAHAHSPVTIALAKRYQLSDAEIAATPPAQLDHLVLHLDRQAQANQSFPTVPPAPTPPPAPVAPEVYDWGTDESGRPIPETDVHPATVAAVKRLREVERRLEATEARVEQEANARANKNFYRTLDQLHASQPAIYGTGPSHLISPESPEGIRRSTMRMHLQRLHQSKQATTLEADYARINAALYPGAPTATTAPALPAAAPSAWDLAALASPTSQRSPERMSRRDQMIAEERALRQANGHFQPAESLNDDLPD